MQFCEHFIEWFSLYTTCSPRRYVKGANRPRSMQQLLDTLYPASRGLNVKQVRRDFRWLPKALRESKLSVLCRAPRKTYNLQRTFFVFTLYVRLLAIPRSHRISFRVLTYLSFISSQTLLFATPLYWRYVTECGLQATSRDAIFSGNAYSTREKHINGEITAWSPGRRWRDRNLQFREDSRIGAGKIPS